MSRLAVLKRLQCFCKCRCFVPLFGFDVRFRIFLNYTASYSPACLLFVTVTSIRACLLQCTVPTLLLSQKNITQARDDERLARVPKMARGKTSLARGIHCSANFLFVSYARPASLYCEEHVCVVCVRVSVGVRTRARVCVCA
jgi:hypothetical protein